MAENMDLRSQIAERMAERATADLLDIWRSNDRAAYSDDAFAAIEGLLTGRGVELPPQAAPPVDFNRQLRQSVTWARSLRVWWAFTWRCGLSYSVLSMGYMVVSYFTAGPENGIGKSARVIMAALAYTLPSIWAIHDILGRQYGDFAIAVTSPQVKGHRTSSSN